MEIMAASLFCVRPEYISAVAAAAAAAAAAGAEQRMEIMEIPEANHPYYVAAQFHPEFKSRVRPPARAPRPSRTPPPTRALRRRPLPPDRQVLATQTHATHTHKRTQHTHTHTHTHTRTHRLSHLFPLFTRPCARTHRRRGLRKRARGGVRPVPLLFPCVCARARPGAAPRAGDAPGAAPCRPQAPL